MLSNTRNVFRHLHMSGQSTHSAWACNCQHDMGHSQTGFKIHTDVHDWNMGIVWGLSIVSLEDKSCGMWCMVLCHMTSHAV